VTPYHFSVAPVRRQSSCQGTRLAWCSNSVMTIGRRRGPGLGRREPPPTGHPPSA
jgi:hypothetical protein